MSRQFNADPAKFAAGGEPPAPSPRVEQARVRYAQCADRAVRRKPPIGKRIRWWAHLRLSDLARKIERLADRVYR
jgi:hypothetical protein